MTQNTIIKDGIGDDYTLRSKDISQAQDNSLRRSMTLATMFPPDYGQNGGAFHRSSRSGLMAPGLATASPIYSFQFMGAGVSMALVRRVRFAFWSMDIAFAAGMAIFEMFVARAFTAQLTGGTISDLTGNNSKLRTSFASSGASIVHSSTAALTGGIFTPDVAPADRLVGGLGATPYTAFVRDKLFEKQQGDMGLLLTQQEGFVIKASVEPTGDWSFVVTTEWDEVPLFTAGY
jgi:hypothetical protein